jgi:hypothetical protein
VWLRSDSSHAGFVRCAQTGPLGTAVYLTILEQLCIGTKPVYAARALGEQDNRVNDN